MGNLCHTHTNVSQSNNTQCSSSQLLQRGIPITEVGILAPLSCLYFRSIMRYLICNIENMRKCHLYNALSAVRWYVTHHNPVVVSIFGINVIKACCQHTNILKLRQLLKLFFLQTTLVRQYDIGILCTFNQLVSRSTIIYGKFAKRFKRFPR